MTQAAEFTTVAVGHSAERTEILAILPEVLRSGSFSKNWQQYVSTLTSIESVEHYGIFDNTVDIDVFLLRMRRASNNAYCGKKLPWPNSSIQVADSVVKDYFDVRCGTIVPHRDPENGKQHCYIHPRSIAPWSEISHFTEKRRHQGVIFQPPFIAIRRTSRAEQPFRAVATLILGKKPVAVENHLIVCTPKDKSVDSCRNLIKQLRTKATNNFLNNKTRCRHLTVLSIKEVPYNPEHK